MTQFFQVWAQPCLEINKQVLVVHLAINLRVQVPLACLEVVQQQIQEVVYLGEQQLEASLDNSQPHNVSARIHHYYINLFGKI